MNSSENINELAAAMAKAQGVGDRFAEAELIQKLTRKIGYSPLMRGSRRTKFLSRIRWGMGECWYWVGFRDAAGYGLFQPKWELRAHRAAWRIFRGEIPEGMKVLHKCDVRCCVNPDHLFLGTQAENIKDMIAKGRARNAPSYGEKNPMARLTQTKVESMRLIRSETGKSYKKIAAKFGCSTMTAFRAITGQSWNHQ